MGTSNRREITLQEVTKAIQEVQTHGHGRVEVIIQEGVITSVHKSTSIHRTK